MLKTRICRLERREDLDGKTLYFMIPSSDRRKRPRFFLPADVPDFDGDVADFEFDVSRKNWRPLRQIT